MKSLLKSPRLGATVVATAIALVGASPNFPAFAQTTPPPATTSATLIEPTIKALQEALNKQGIVVQVNGVLNDETRAAIRKYQSQHHLPVTGEPDKATLDKLGVVVDQGTTAAPGVTTQTQPGMGGMPMMNMMSGMMNMMGNMPMMNMMGMMPMMGPGGMVTIDRVEGRIAFLRTELKIAEAQTGVWNAFADALRANSKRLGEMRAPMMSQADAAQQQPPTLAQRFDVQERWLLARLEGTRAIKSSFASLYGTFSDEQKKTADEILAPHMGLGMMAMMPGQMQPRPMGPGPMAPDRMAPDRMPPSAR